MGSQRGPVGASIARVGALLESQQRLSVFHGTSRQIKMSSLGLLQALFLARHADMWFIEKRGFYVVKSYLWRPGFAKVAPWSVNTACWCHLEPPQRLSAAHGTSRGAPLEPQERVSAVDGIPRHGRSIGLKLKTISLGRPKAAPWASK